MVRAAAIAAVRSALVSHRLPCRVLPERRLPADWQDVDLDRGELRVRHTLSRVDGELVLTDVKTDRSRRRMPLHAGVVTALKGWRTQQLQERLAAGDQWTDTGVVFATELGTMVDPRNMLRAVELAAKKAGIEDVGAHTMAA